MKTAIIVLTLAAAALAQTAAPAGDAKNGKKLFAADGCYQCHGYEAQCATPTGPRLGPRPIAFAQFSKYVRQPTGQRSEERRVGKEGRAGRGAKDERRE